MRVLTVFLLLAMSPYVASAQPTSGDQALDDRQLLGMRLFNQSCRVCHTKPQMVSPLYGPELSRSSLGGRTTRTARYVATAAATSASELPPSATSPSSIASATAVAAAHFATLSHPSSSIGSRR